MVLHLGVTLRAGQPWHPDEHFQILEFAWARMGLAPLAELPWEYAAQVRPTLQPALAMAALGLLRAVGIDSPFTWALALRLATLVIALATVLRVVAHTSPGLSRDGRRILWLLALFCWFAPFLLFRFTSENLGAIALVAGFTFIGAGAKPRDGVIAGLLFGLAFAFRFQMAFAIVPAFVWMGVQGGWRQVVRPLAVSGIVVAVAAAVDWWFYDAVVFTPWEYFHANIVEGVASRFGTSPWWSYFLWAPVYAAPPFGAVLVALVVVGAVRARRSVWSWAMAGYLLAHIVTAHKEPRFLFPLVYFVPPLAAFAWEALPTRVRWRPVTALLVAQNVVLALVLLVFTPLVNRNREFDWEFIRFLWTTAESVPGRTVYVLSDAGDPFRAGDSLRINVYRHPRVRGVEFQSGDSLPGIIARGTPPEELLVLTRKGANPSVAGASGYDEVYRSEAGYRTVARALGADGSPFVAYLERADNWTTSAWVRRLHRVRMGIGEE